jgi:cation diffusion facilitator CzcD-associated flavoprotein CzcO
MSDADEGDQQERLAVEAMRERYQEERSKRLRAEGNEQFEELSGRLARFAADPWAGAQVEHEPRDEDVEVVVIGGGFGGLLASALLRKSGVQSLRVVEKGSDFGGVWYWNRYPGVQCDIDATVYLPLLEEVGYVPTEKYASGQEIFEYCRMVARTYDLYRDALLATEVTGARWDEERVRWVVTTDRGDRLTAKSLVVSPGGQHRPRLPGIPGIQTFGGHIFHTSRWDYEYTGGDATGGMTGLRDKRVGVIGTGATALQCVPLVAQSAAELFIFQRTPSVVQIRGQRPTPDDFAASLEPGWQRRRMENFMQILTGGDVAEDVIDDGWTYAMRALSSNGARPVGEGAAQEPDAEAAAEVADFELMEQVRARVAATVEDPQVAESLMPYYRFMCKRPGFSDDYLETFNLPSVTLVDTKGAGVEKITESGAVAGGREYALDCLILATGFDVGRGYLRTAGFEVEGRAGVKLSEVWNQGPQTFHGFLSPGFPNCFFMGNTQSGINVNFVHALWEQAVHVAFLVQTLRVRGLDRMEAEPAAADAWASRFRVHRKRFVQFQKDCTPGYFNNEGNPDDPNGILASRFPDGALAFYRILKEWRDDPALPGLQLS